MSDRCSRRRASSATATAMIACSAEASSLAGWSLSALCGTSVPRDHAEWNTAITRRCTLPALAGLDLKSIHRHCAHSSRCRCLLGRPSVPSTARSTDEDPLLARAEAGSALRAVVADRQHLDQSVRATVRCSKRPDERASGIECAVTVPVPAAVPLHAVAPTPRVWTTDERHWISSERSGRLRSSIACCTAIRRDVHRDQR